MGAGNGRWSPASLWAERSIRTKGLAVVVLPVAVLLLASASTLWLTHVTDSEQAASLRATQTAQRATALQGDVARAVTALQGYLSSADPNLQLTRSRAEQAVPAEERALMSSAGTSGSVSRAAEAVDVQARRTVAVLDPLESQRPTVVLPSGVRVALSSAVADSNRLHGDLVALEHAVSTLVANERHAEHRAHLALGAVAVAAVLLAAAGGALASRRFTTGMVTRLRHVEDVTTAVEGEVRDGTESVGDEIARLSALLGTRTTQLRQRADERDRARAELEDILTASPVVSLRYETSSGAGRFTYASSNLQRLLGVSAEEARRDPASVIGCFHSEDRRRLEEKIRAAAGPLVGRVEMVLRFRRDPARDDWRHAEGAFLVEADAAGHLARVRGYLVDVTERHVAQRAAEERRFMLESIFHASPDTIVLRDVDNEVVLASSLLAEVIDTAGDRVVPGPKLVEDAHTYGQGTPEDRAVLDRLLERTLAGQPDTGPVVTTELLPDGDVRTFETRARPVLDQAGSVTGTVTISRDVTQRVRLEESLRRASDAAERASDAKSQFLSRMSHELRTPLNAILGFAQLLELDDLPEHEASSVDQIQRAGRHLLSLINEVLDISRIEAGRLSVSTQPVEIGDVVDEVSALLTPAARHAYVRADRQRLLQVLLNLGDNAVKYNSRAGMVAFRTSLVPGERVRFEVHDTGVGIPAGQQSELFQPFSRLAAEGSTVEGTGVGLALSKQLVELMGGTIGVESVAGRGSTFWVELQLAEPPRRPVPGRRRAPAGLSAAGVASGPDAPDRAHGDDTSRNVAIGPSATGNGATGNGATGKGATGSGTPGAGTPGTRQRAERATTLVLSIEDNPSNASLIAQVLGRRHGVELLCASEARLGLELARRRRPDLVLLDLHLPDLSGEELFLRLKALPELADTKVVIVSADATPSRVRRMLDLGVDGYLTKPVDVEALLRLVDGAIVGGGSGSR